MEENRSSHPLNESFDLRLSRTRHFGQRCQLRLGRIGHVRMYTYAVCHGEGTCRLSGGADFCRWSRTALPDGPVFPVPPCSILRLASVAAHLHDLRIEAGDYFHEVGLFPHYILDVLVHTGSFVGSR